MKLGKDDFLVLENKDGSAELISTKAMKRTVQICKAKIDIVFLSACYSEKQANAFLDAGVSHVIAINKDNSILDESCIVFSKAFYQAYFSH